MDYAHLDHYSFANNIIISSVLQGILTPEEFECQLHLQLHVSLQNDCATINNDCLCTHRLLIACNTEPRQKRTIWLHPAYNRSPTQDACKQTSRHVCNNNYNDDPIGRWHAWHCTNVQYTHPQMVNHNNIIHITDSVGVKNTFIIQFSLNPDVSVRNLDWVSRRRQYEEVFLNSLLQTLELCPRSRSRGHQLPSSAERDDVITVAKWWIAVRDACMVWLKCNLARKDYGVWHCNIMIVFITGHN